MVETHMLTHLHVLYVHIHIQTHILHKNTCIYSVHVQVCVLTLSHTVTHTHTPHPHTHSLEHDDLSDDEVWESGEDDSDDETNDKAVKRTISATKAVTVGGASFRMRGRAKTIDSTLKPMSRLHLYDHQTWRMEVCVCVGEGGCNVLYTTICTCTCTVIALYIYEINAYTSTCTHTHCHTPTHTRTMYIV